MEVGILGVAAASLGIGFLFGPSPRREHLQLLALAHEGRVTDIEELVESGFEVDARGTYGETALQLAAAEGHASVVRALLSLGALATSRNRLPVPAVPPLSSPSRTSAHAAAFGGHSDVLMALLDRDVSVVDAFDADGATPLHLACLKDQRAAVEVLCKHGVVAVSSRNPRTGATPLSLAANQGLLEIVQLCLAYGAEPNAPDREGNTPLHRCCVNMHSLVCECLCLAGASLHTLNKQGATPLVLAYQLEHRSVDEMRKVLEECLVHRRADRNPEIITADVARERLEARLMVLARDDPTTLSKFTTLETSTRPRPTARLRALPMPAVELLEDHTFQMTIIQLQASVRVLPRSALEHCNPEVIEWLAHAAHDATPHAVDTGL